MLQDPWSNVLRGDGGAVVLVIYDEFKTCNWAAPDCMVIVLAPVVEAARLPRVCPVALGYGLPPL